MCTAPPIVKADRGIKTSARLRKVIGLVSHRAVYLTSETQNGLTTTFLTAS